MPLRDHDELLMKYLDSPEAIAEYLNEAIELGHEEHLKHALDIVRRKAGEGARNSFAAAAEVQRMLAPLHVTVRFEALAIQANA
jgi:DNA-binding phage protein